MNRAMRRSQRDFPDIRLWDHEPLRAQRWLDAEIIVLPPESELDRDAAWGKAHGWEWTYFPDGSKTATTPHGKTIRFPAKEELAA